MFCHDCYQEIKNKSHYKTKKHSECVNKNILIRVIGENVSLIPPDEDAKTVDPRTFKSNNYHQYINASIKMGRECRDYRSISIFPSGNIVKMYDDIHDELLRQADRLMYTYSNK